MHIGILTNGRFSVQITRPDTTGPPGVDIVQFYGFIVDATGNPAPNVELTFSVACPPTSYDEMLITVNSIVATTDENGEFTIDLLRGVPYKVSIRKVGVYMAFTVPGGAVIVNLFELLDFD